ncbi:MAG: PQQ-binding-like beta-propeller repeat protein [Planctomycetota bacterium]
MNPRILQPATNVTMLLIAFAATQPGLEADDWPQFLGKARNGLSAESGLISAIPKSGLKDIWNTPLGVGMSGLAVADGRLFTMFQDESAQYAVSLSTTDGSILWKSEIAAVYQNAMGHGPRATPCLYEAMVLIYSGEGILVSLDLKTGEKNWTVNVPRELGGQPSEYGMSCSPLVADGKVIVHAGTPSAAIAAFDSETGKLSWTAGQGNAGYSSPVLMTLAGKTQIVSLTGAGAAGINPQDGTVLWFHEFPTEYDCNTANPVQLSDDTVLISAGENHGTAVLKIEPEGDIQQASEAWTSFGKDSQLRAEWQTPVVIDGHLYGLDNVGSAGPITNLVCIRLKDFETVWQKTRFGKSNLTAADGKLFLTTMDGELVLIEATPAAFRELGRTSVLESTRQAPVIADGRLFVRDDQRVMCFDIRASR